MQQIGVLTFREGQKRKLRRRRLWTKGRDGRGKGVREKKGDLGGPMGGRTFAINRGRTLAYPPEKPIL